MGSAAIVILTAGASTLAMNLLRVVLGIETAFDEANRLKSQFDPRSVII